MNFVVVSNMSSKKKLISLAELFSELDCVVTGDMSDIRVAGLANDSRKVKPKDLFFALPGFVTDGVRFISEAISLGAAAIVTQADVAGLEGVAVIRCRDAKKAMSLVASRFYGFPSTKLPVVGVTGTNGKTTVSYLFCHIMKNCGQNWGKIGTVEYFTGQRTVTALNTTPDALQLQSLLAEMRDSGMHGCVMEVSSHALDQGRCDDIEFSGAVFTNLTQDHLDYHKDMESYFKAKSVLFARLLKEDGFAVLNYDDSHQGKIRSLCRGRVLTFSTAQGSGLSGAADVKITDEGYRDNRQHFIISFKDSLCKGDMPLMGRFNLTNAAAAVASAIAAGCRFDDAVDALRTAPQVPGRVEKVEAGQPFAVIIDYAHTPDALKNLLTGVDTPGDKILVFGCGGDRDRAKRPLMGEIAVAYAEKVFITSDNPRGESPKRIINDILKGIHQKTKVTVIEDRIKAIGEALSVARPSDLVIIAGKGHEDYQVVGNRRLYFSDPEVVKTHLKKMGYAGC